jgi:hypothetical protein
VHGLNVIRQTEVHIADSLVFQPGSFEDRIVKESLKKYKWSDTDQIQAEIIHIGVKYYA